VDEVLKVIIAGGGTGGHLFPGVAIAEEFLKRGATSVLFVITGKKLEKDILGERGFNYRTIRIAGFKGKGLQKALGALCQLPGSMWESYRIIREFHPQLVIGVGGYASGPVVLAAHLMGIKTAVAEQNALPGLANRILGKFVDKVFLTYRESRKWFPVRAKVIVTGNPVRADFISGQGSKKDKDGRFTILTFGGSQGARSINRALLRAVMQLRNEIPNLRIIHQTGQDDLNYVTDAYRTYGIEAEVLPFIRDMAAAYRDADLVVCRAGATSIAEVTVMGKAAILVPFPFAVDDHQKKNALELVKAGAAMMVEERELTSTDLAETIKKLYYEREVLRDMEMKAARLGNVRAAADIVDNCLDLSGSHRGKN